MKLPNSYNKSYILYTAVSLNEEADNNILYQTFIFSDVFP